MSPRRIALAAAAAALVVACGGSSKPATKAAAKPGPAGATQPAAAAPEAPKSEQKPAQDWAYSSVGKRDPGGILPLVMSSLSRTTSSPVSDRGADNGRVTERPVRGLLIVLTLPGGQSSYDMTSAYHAPADRSTNPASPRVRARTNHPGGPT